MTRQDKRSHGRLRRLLTVGLLSVGMVAAPVVATTATADVTVGDSVYVGDQEGYPGTGIFPIWSDGVQTGDPDFWAYCLENQVTAYTDRLGTVADASDFLGVNYFAGDTSVQGKVMWVLANSYPALSLTEFAAAIGIPSISREDATEATQYAVWRYTDLNFDGTWNYESPASEAAYLYLIAGANSSPGLTPADLAVTAEIAAPTASQTAGSLVGPFVVTTNQPTVSVSVAPTLAVTDVNGDPVNVNAVTNGQELYLDLRGDTTAGNATITVSAQGATGSGRIVSIPVVPGETPTTANHAQTIILIAPSTATTNDDAAVSWAAQPVAAVPAIGTSLVDAADGDRVIPATGGTVIDTVTYENLTPGTEYTLTGQLMRKSDGSATGITGSLTFTPTTANGSVDVTFTVPTGYAGQSLVAFERLYEGTDTSVAPVAVHEDINDAAQTVSVASVVTTTPQTPTNTTTGGNLADTGGSVPYAALGACVLLLLAGGLLVARRRAQSAS